MTDNKLNIALIGYGKMGRTIEEVANDRGHSICSIIGSGVDIDQNTLQGADVAIEFTVPHAANENLQALSSIPVPTVCGTTGWLDKLAEIEVAYKEAGSSFIYASNFSLGVNVFFAMNKHLAKIMKNIQGYGLEILESHHTTKKDAPSGTAVTIAEQVIETNDRYTKWQLKQNLDVSQDHIPIESIREADVKGLHEISYISEIDKISIKHEAFSRPGFALGAVLAAEYIVDKKGIFSMSDVLGL